MQLTSMQLALFLKDMVERPDLLMYQINSELGSVFDAMPTILDAPKDLPDSIPVVKVRSSDQIHKLTLSWRRVDLIIYPQQQDSLDPLESFNLYRETLDKYAHLVSSKFDLVRVGLISNLFQEHANAIEVLGKEYLKDSFSPKTSEFCLRFNETQEINGFRLNNVKIVETGVWNMHRGILLQSDTNNVVDTSKTLSQTAIDSILDIATEQLNQASDLI